MRRGNILATFAIATLVAALPAAAPLGRPSFHAPRPSVDFRLTLGERTFDPLKAVPLVDPVWSVAGDLGPDLRIVQFDGPIREHWLEDLRDRGIEPVQYIHPFAYIAWSDAAAVDTLRGASHVRWSGDFLNGYRVLPRWRALDDGVIEARALLCRAADTGKALNDMAAAGATRIQRRVLDDRFEVASFMVPGSAFQSLSTIAGIYTIQPRPLDGGLRSEMSCQVNAGNVDAGNMAYPGYRDWLTEVGIDGGDVIIAIVDGGSDQGHTDLLGQFASCTGESCGGSASSSHGTHTAGIVAATGVSGLTDGGGFLRGLGVAPGATLIEQVYSPVFSDPGGMLQLMTESSRNGAVASSNSWGPSGSPLGYDIDTMEVDIGVRDADPDLAGDQSVSYVLAIMNGNGGTSSQGTPDEAKNIFTIGCTNMRTSSGSQDPDIDDISSNSAHGPCLDGRTIPHMVAPGCRVESTVPGSYGLMCGTSMACPQVAGGAALFVEHYRLLEGSDPTPAMIKAAFTAAARDLAGNDDADGNTLGHPFDSKQGWGRMYLPSVLEADPDGVRYFDAPVVLDATGQVWTTTVSPLDPSQPMKIMLAWTDAPGHGLGGSSPAWNNDLDLVADTSLGQFRGNNFATSGWSTTGGSADNRNNTEGIFLGPTPPQVVTIRVEATNLNSDGVPNSGDSIDQDFAVVCYNCAVEPGFSLSVDPPIQSLCLPGSVDYQVEVGQILGYDLPVTMLADGLPQGLTASFSANPVIPPQTVTMTIVGPPMGDDGQYDFQVVGIAPDMTRSAPAAIGVSSESPEQVELESPANGAVDAPLRPTLMWRDADGAITYRVQISTSSGSGGVLIDESGIEGLEYQVEMNLDVDTSYWWRAAASNHCGDGDWSSWWTFHTSNAMTILLVDDDDNSPDVRSIFTDSLENLGVLWDLWDTANSDNEPSAAKLSSYPLVVWFTGDEFGGAAGPGSSGEAALSAYIDGGGRLLLSSQDYLWDRGLTSFGQAYLGIGDFDSDVGQDSVTGQGELFGDIGSITLNFPFYNWSDRVTPGGGGELAFLGNEGDAATSKLADEGGGAIFLGFPLAAVDGDAREEILSIVLTWAAGGGGGCVADCTGDGVVDVSDLLAIIADWGGQGCDPTGDGVVDVSDILAVIAAWGDC